MASPSARIPAQVRAPRRLSRDARREQLIDARVDHLDAVFLTHEHADHVGGVPAFAGRHGIAVWGSFGTLAAAAHRFDGLDRVCGFDSHVAFAIGDLEITPIPVPHDAREPTQFLLGNGAVRLGVLTDLGVSTPHVEATLSGCDALVLETNHCLDLLAGSDYPYPLKQRIAGRLGHLDNGSSAALLGRIDILGGFAPDGTATVASVLPLPLPIWLPIRPPTTRNAPILGARRIFTVLSGSLTPPLSPTRAGGRATGRPGPPRPTRHRMRRPAPTSCPRLPAPSATLRRRPAISPCASRSAASRRQQIGA